MKRGVTIRSSNKTKGYFVYPLGVNEAMKRPHEQAGSLFYPIRDRDNSKIRINPGGYMPINGRKTAAEMMITREGGAF